jgi:hypothetical protein
VRFVEVTLKGLEEASRSGVSETEMARMIEEASERDWYSKFLSQASQRLSCEASAVSIAQTIAEHNPVGQE